MIFLNLPTFNIFDFRIIIPQKFSKSISDYLENISKRYTFSDTAAGVDGKPEHNQVICYDGIPLFDIRESQPVIDLHEIRFNSLTSVRSMVTAIHFKNVFKVEARVNIFLASTRP